MVAYIFTKNKFEKIDLKDAQLRPAGLKSNIWIRNCLYDCYAAVNIFSYVYNDEITEELYSICTYVMIKRVIVNSYGKLDFAQIVISANSGQSWNLNS